MKNLVFAVSLLAATLCVPTAAHADRLAYPSADAASFLIDYPASWTMTPAEEEGDYVELAGKDGAMLFFRTIEGSEEALLAAIQDSKDYLAQDYSNVVLSKAKDVEQHGLKGFLATGTGTNEDGDDVNFLMAWFPLPDGTIGELWYAAFADDARGAKEAAAILNSFRAP
ncbi:MAG: hypothetical protein R3F18_11545 [Lysobacterales bacterium]